MGTFFELGKIKAAKGEERGSNPTAPMATRLWETFIFTSQESYTAKSVNNTADRKLMYIFVICTERNN